MTINALDDKITPENLKELFGEIISEEASTRYKLELKIDRKVAYEKSLKKWEEIEAYLNTSISNSPEFLCKWLNMIPIATYNQHNFEMVVLTALIQKYDAHTKGGFLSFWTTELKPETYKIDLISKLCKVRYTLVPDKYGPESIMYDFNWLKLAVPTDEFLDWENNIVPKINPRLKKEALDRKRNSLFKLFRERGWVFGRDEFKHRFNAQAIENVEMWLQNNGNAGEDKKIIKQLTTA